MSDLKSKLLVYVLSFGIFSIISTEMGIVGMLPTIADVFNVSITNAGLFLTVYTIGGTVSGLITPLIFSNSNRKKVMVTTFIVFMICTGGLLFTNSFNVALLLRFIPSFFHPIFLSFAFSIAAKNVSPEDVPKSAAKIIMGVSAGMILGVPIVNFIINISSFTVAIGFLTFINLISLIMLVLVMPDVQFDKKSISSQLKILKKGSLLLSIVAVVLLTGGMYITYSYITPFLTFKGVEGTTTSLFLVIYGISSLGGNYIGGNLLSSNSKLTCLVFPVVGSFIYLVLFGIDGSNVLIYIVTVIWGVLAGLGNNIVQYLIVSTVPEAPEFGNGVYFSAVNLGVTVGTQTAARIIDSININFISIGGVALFIAGLIFVFLRFKKVKMSIVSG